MQVTWTQGATQGGSSGAALIDADTRKVVGVLTGGTTTCDIFSGADYFGKLSVVSQVTVNSQSYECAPEFICWSLAALKAPLCDDSSSTSN